MARTGSKNKGEWSEFYVFLNMLKNSRVYAADANLNRLDDVFYVIKKIIRNEGGETYTYVLQEDGEEIEIFVNGRLQSTIGKDTIFKDEELIVDALGGESESGTVYIDDIDETISKYHIKNINQNSRSKADITLEIHDYHSGIDQTLPFSIKSFAGSRPTLVNSSKQTNFIYSVEGPMSDDEAVRINTMVNPGGKADVMGRVAALRELGCELKFKNVQSKTFEGNLRLVDSSMPEILAELLKARFESGCNDLRSLSEIISKSNPLNYAGSQPFYKYKISKYLMESFTGMIPSVVWDGYEDAHGGYIVVKRDLEILCLHLNNRNEFEEYLFNSSEFDTYSVTRSEYARVERTLDGYIFKLNLSIRLKK